MEHETIEGLIPAYALGATDPDESHVVEEHLPSCSQCRALLVDHRMLADDMLFAVSPISAPFGLTERMQKRLELARPAEAQRPWWTRLRRGLLVPALAAAILLLVVSNVYWIGRTQGLERRATTQTSTFEALVDAPAVYLQANTAVAGEQGVVYASSDGALALVCVYGMPALPADKTYQVWLVKDGRRESGGVFNVSEYGFGLLVVRPQGSLDGYDSMGISVEPAGGSSAPTSPHVLRGSL